MKAVITVIGKDCVGILAEVSTVCKQSNANVIDVTQTVMQDMFAMIMMVDISKIEGNFTLLSDRLADLGKRLNLSVHVMHEDIFNTMHHI